MAQRSDRVTRSEWQARADRPRRVSQDLVPLMDPPDTRLRYLLDASEAKFLKASEASTLLSATCWPSPEPRERSDRVLRRNG